MSKRYILLMIEKVAAEPGGRRAGYRLLVYIWVSDMAIFKSFTTDVRRQKVSLSQRAMI